MEEWRSYSRTLNISIWEKSKNIDFKTELRDGKNQEKCVPLMKGTISVTKHSHGVIQEVFY